MTQTDFSRKHEGFIKGLASNLLKYVVIVLLISLPLVALSYSAMAQENPPTASLIVKMVKGLSAEEQLAVIERDGGVLKSSIPQLRIYIVEVPEADVDAAMEMHKNDPAVATVELNRTHKVEGVPSDAMLMDQWALPKIGWDTVYGNDVMPAGTAKVAILDTGIDASHPDLANMVVPGHSLLNHGSDGTIDPNGHRTWLTGIVAAQTNNFEGIAGVAYAGVQVMPVQVIGASGEGQDSDIVTGVIWAVDNGADVILNGAFTDTPSDMPHTVQWRFDGINPTTGTVNENPLGGGTVAGSFKFTQPGVYLVSLTVTDSLGDSGTASTGGDLEALIVIYDPCGGFVTGGGWIMSPPGAFPAAPTLIGKANFGFVSKYQKGANIPTGETEFQFKAGDLNFQSTSYQWLVVSGAKAQYKGVSTSNGVPGFGFLLSAAGGQVQGGSGVDKFRIKIWDLNNNGAIVYDNVLGASGDIDTANPLPIGGGSMVIHKRGSMGRASNCPQSELAPANRLSTATDPDWPVAVGV